MQTQYVINSDKSWIDLDVVHNFLRNCHWAKGISRELVEKSIHNSLCFGVYEVSEGISKQIGFARVISDFATFAYLSDVFVLESHRGNDLAKQLLTEIMKHPELQGLRRWMLVTTNAHGLYEQFGFSTPLYPEKIMEIFVPNLYEKEAELLSSVSEKTLTQ